MYTKDKTNRITLRLNDEQFRFVTLNCEPLGISPSEFLRMVINATMAKVKEECPDFYRKEIAGRENDKADQHDLV